MTITRSLTEYLNIEYPIVIERFSDGDFQGYTAFIEEFGRYACYGTGESLEEALRTLEIAKENLIREYLKRGREIPVPSEEDYAYSGRFVLRVPKDLHKALVQEANRNQHSLNSYLIYALTRLVYDSKFKEQARYGSYSEVAKWELKGDLSPNVPTRGFPIAS